MKDKIEITPEKKYQWNQDWANSIAHTDINKVIEELKAIEESRGELTPEYIVESSKNKNSILHSYFEWNDAKAANSWRLNQAKKLLREIEVVVIKDGETKRMRVYDITKKAFGENDMWYKRFDLMTSADLVFIRKVALADLRRVRNKLDVHSACPACVSHIDLAIEVLSKESTETEKEPTGLKAVG